MFANPDFGIARSPCIGLHCPTSFGKVGWQSCNMPMGIKKLVSNTDMECATSCSAKTKNSSMHAFISLVLGRGMEYFTLSGCCESQSIPGGRSSFCLVDPNNSDSSKAQSLVLRSSNLDRTSLNLPIILNLRSSQQLSISRTHIQTLYK